MNVYLLTSLVLACVANGDKDDSMSLLQTTDGIQHGVSSSGPGTFHRKGVISHPVAADPLTCDAQQRCHDTCLVDVFNGRETPQFKMLVAENDMYVSRTALCTGSVWELDSALRVIEVLGQVSRGHFLDIGANLGSYSLTVASWMRQSAAAEARKVLAIEASGDTSQMLSASVHASGLSSLLDVRNMAVVSDGATRKICLNGGTHDSATNLGGAQADRGTSRFRACEQEVPASTVDDLYAAEPGMMGGVVVAKLDCEGCEGPALLGARSFLAEHPPCVLLMEVTETHLCRNGMTLNQVKALLDEAGYEPLQSETHGDGTCAGYQQWEAKHGMPTQSFEFLRQKDFGRCMERFL